MRVVRNIGYVRRRRTGARMMLGIGLVLLVASFVFTFLGMFLIFVYAGLIVGFLLFNNGLAQLTRWGRKARNDELLDDALTRLNDRFTLIHYADFPGRRPDHILITPSGLLVLTSKEIPGRVSVRGRSWRRMGAMLSRFFLWSGPQLGNPTIENEHQVAAVQNVLTAESLPGEVEGAIVFLHPNSEVEVHESEIPILHVTELLDYVRSRGDGVTLGNQERERLAAALSRGEELEQVTSAPSAPKKRIRAA